MQQETQNTTDQQPVSAVSKVEGQNVDQNVNKKKNINKKNINISTGNLKEKAAVLFKRFDTSLSKLIPDQKLRKIIHYVIFSLLSFTILLTLLGIVFSLVQPRGENGYVIQKPSVSQPSEEPRESLTKNEKDIAELKKQIQNFAYPPTQLSIPEIITDIEIE